MSKPKQTTLFQSWGGRSQGPHHSICKEADLIKNRPVACKSHNVMKGVQTSVTDTIDLCSDDDEEDRELVRALEESLAHQQTAKAEIVASSSEGGCGAVENEGNISFGIDDIAAGDKSQSRQCLSQWRVSDVPVGDLPGFDRSTGAFWIYPTNYPVREYQFNIVKKAIVRNTLVTLPTGLGKTFIASVIMYNFYRWYPEGKIVFMAPTKPLVAQQIEACYNIMGIPQADTAEMTGTMNPSDRQKAWQGRRVFFLTPQVLTNDLSRGSCPAVSIKCLVVDEAHKALGNHAYCQVLRELVKYTKQFRVLALSATPGSDLKAVQQVVSNLLISHIELRSEECADIKPYTHERTVDKIVVPLGDELSTIKAQYIQILSLVVQRLIQCRVLYKREPTSLSKFLILKAREAFRQNPPESLPRSQYGVLEGDFAVAMSLYHGYELLQLHGQRSLYTFLDGLINGEKSHSRTRAELLRNADFSQIMDILQKKFRPQPSSQNQSKQTFQVGHPKMEKLQQIVLEHFHKFEAEGKATRVMIFAQYRDTVLEITELLKQHEPLVKVMSFIGQSSNGKTTKGFTQKEQLKVMHSFRNGGFNTLVSTCVGEEGLDIGEVDLIVCFDAHKSPIRLVQRMGRTGRKRQGHIVMLVTVGREEQIYNQSQYSKRSIHKAIMNGARTLVFYNNNPRMIPEDLSPACHRMYITVKHQPTGAKQQKKKGAGRKANGNIPELFSSAKEAVRLKKGEQEEITLEEYAELHSASFQAQSKHFPKPRMLSLLSTTSISEDGDKEREINLTEWLPWQNALQQTSHFSHSKRSSHLVELLEFIDLQQLLPYGEDNYKQEMDLYLNMDDVVGSYSKQQRAGAMRQFCVPTRRDEKSSAGEGPSEQAGQEKKEEKCKDKRTVSCKRRHPAALQMEDEFDEDSDVLPEVDLSFPPENTALFSDNMASHSEINQKSSKELKPHVTRQKHANQKAKPERPKLVLDLDDLEDFDVGTNLRRERGDTEDQYQMRDERFMQEVVVHLGDADVYPEEPAEECAVSFNNKAKRSPVFCVRKHPQLTSTSDVGEDIRESDVAKELHMLRVPTPPSQEEIPILLNCVELARDAFSLDLQDLATQCKSFLFSSELLSGSVQRQARSVDEAKRKERNKLSKESFPADSFESINFDSVMNRLVKTSKQPITSDDKKLEKRTMKVPETVEIGNFSISKRLSAEDSEEAEREGLDLGLQVECEKNRLIDAKDKQEKEVKTREGKVGNPCVKQASSENFTDSFIRINFQDDNDDDFYSKVKTPLKSPGVPSSPDFSHRKGESVDMLLESSSCPPAITESTKDSACRRKSPCGTITSGNVTGHTSFMDKDRFFSGDSSKILPYSEERHRNDSMYTFTQALAFVHGHSSLVSTPGSHTATPEILVAGQKDRKHSDDCCSEKKVKAHVTSSVHQSLGTDFMKSNVSQGQTKLDVDTPDKIESHTVEDSPNFDLAFDFDDEDIIPPSPEAVTQTAFRAQPSAVSNQPCSNAQSIKFEEKKKSGFEYIADVGDFDDDDAFVGIAEHDIDQHSSHFASSFHSASSAVGVGTSKQQGGLTAMSEDVLKNLRTSTLPEKVEAAVEHCGKAESKTDVRICSEQLDTKVLPASKDFHCQQGLKPYICSASSIASVQDPDPDRLASFALELDDDFDEVCVEQLNTGETSEGDLVPEVQPLPATKLKEHTSDPGCEKVTVFHEPPFEMLEDHLLRGGAETPVHSVIRKEASVQFCCSTPVSNKKLADFSKRHTNKTADVTTKIAPKFRLKFGEDSESDFEDDMMIKQRSKATHIHSPPTSDGDLVLEADKNVNFKVPDFGFSEQMTRKKQQKKKKNKKRCPFLDEEAELSDDVDVSSDEEEDNLDAMENSFIDTDTQLTQVSQTDMQAVYLRSVRSPPVHAVGANAGRFRLQHNPTSFDVFSQPRRAEMEESQYEQDSFCVDSEQEEDDKNRNETEDEDFDLTVVNRRKICMKRKRAASSRQVKGRKRVRQLVDSSDDEEEVAERSPCSQETPALRRSQAIKALLSSSDDHTDTSVHHRSSSVLWDDGVQRDQLSKLEILGTSASQGFNCQKQPLLVTESCFTDADCCEDKLAPDSQHQNRKNPEVSFGLRTKTNEKQDSCFYRQSALGQYQHPPQTVEEKPGLTATDIVRETCKLGLWQKSSAMMPTAVKADATGNQKDSGSTSTKYLTDDGKGMTVFKEEAIATECGLGGTDLSGCVGNAKSRRSSVDSSFWAAKQQKNKMEDKGVEDQSENDAVQFTSLANQERGKVVILVDSREVGGAQDVVSSLRLQHSLHVCTWQLKACDYVLSNRMGVERLSWSGFSSSANRSKLCNRLRQMQSLYDRCVVIVEKDRVKPGEEKATRQHHHTKYVDSVLSQFNQTTVRVFFTDNQGETAELLARISNAESRKGMAIMAPISILTEKQQMVNFYMSLPQLTVTHALNICFNFGTIQKFLQSSVAHIQVKGHMSFARATEVYNYVRHQFSAELLPKK